MKNDKDKEIDIKNSIQVMVTPWEKGFTCGILMNQAAKMSTEHYELCSTVARGMIKMATSDPHETFKLGIKGFAEDRKSKKLPHEAEFIAKESHDTEDECAVIDFIEALKKQRDKLS